MSFQLIEPLNREMVSTKYCIDLGLKSFKKVFDRDCLEETSLYEELMKIKGIIEVEYDAMWGPYIWIEFEGLRGKDLNLWLMIQNTINAYISGR